MPNDKLIRQGENLNRQFLGTRKTINTRRISSSNINISQTTKVSSVVIPDYLWILSGDNHIHSQSLANGEFVLSSGDNEASYAYYKLDEDSDLSSQGIKDSGCFGNNNPATASGYTVNDGTGTNITFVSDDPLGEGRQSASFNGNSSYIYASTQNLPGEYTISMWVKNPGKTKSISGFAENQPTGVVHEKEFHTMSDGRVRFRGYDGGAKLVTSSTNIDDGSWHYISATAINGGLLKLYINGIQEDTTSVGTLYNGYSTPFFTLGIESQVTQYNNGNIAYPRIWNKQLTQSEIQAEMNSAYPVKTEGLVGSWLLDGGY